MVIAFDFEERCELEKKLHKLLKIYGLKGNELVTCSNQIIDITKTILNLEELELE